MLVCGHHLATNLLVGIRGCNQQGGTGGAVQWGQGNINGASHRWTGAPRVAVREGVSNRGNSTAMAGQCGTDKRRRCGASGWNHRAGETQRRSIRHQDGLTHRISNPTKFVASADQAEHTGANHAWCHREGLGVFSGHRNRGGHGWHAIGAEYGGADNGTGAGGCCGHWGEGPPVGVVEVVCIGVQGVGRARQNGPSDGGCWRHGCHVGGGRGV